MIQVIQRALDILEFLAGEPQTPRTLGEIANTIGIQPSTCANIVKTLTQRGYVVKTQNQKAYCLGQQWNNMLFKHVHYEKLITVSKVELEKLTAMLNENTSVAILENDLRKVVVKRDSSQQIQAQTPDVKNAYDTSTGRLLLAMKTNDELKVYIDTYGLPDRNVWPEIADEQRFYVEIEKIRGLGYALIEDSVQVIGFAAPIFFNDKAIAALSIYVPAFRYSDRLRSLFTDLGLRTAQRITELLKL